MNTDIKDWADKIWDKIDRKLIRTSRSTECRFPYTTENGKFVEHSSGNINFWTNGFWAGILWMMYLETGDENYRKKAETAEEGLDEALYGYWGLSHDVGFMWHLSSVANYRATANEKSLTRGIIAANYLSGRYHAKGEFIKAWGNRGNSYYNAIIDCMMNLPLLYWASEETDDPRYKFIAEKHADTVIRTFIRDDGSVNHINLYDSETGEFKDSEGGQGYRKGSSWTRGQAWAIYGFVLSYIHTKEERYLNAAKRVAHYFMAALSATGEFVPNCDFRAPKEPVYKDTTAGVVAACGLIELSRAVPEFEQSMYLDFAIKILKETEEKYADWTENEDAIIQMGTEAYSQGHNMPIIYGDFFFIEAILKLKGSDIFMW